MTPRTILYTGKGGVGKTSVAACTARRCAAAGLRTLVISTDPAHSLSESLGAELGGEPVEVADHLWGQEVKAQEEMERHWSGVQEWLGELFVERGMDRISAEELTVPPGMDELFSLLRLQAHNESGRWDAIIVDCAPTGETLRLLSFPDVARWWIEKVFPYEKQILAAARPLARSLLDISLPGSAAFADVQRLSQNLIAMNEILRDRSRCSIRLVMNPDKMVIGEAMRTFTYLNLYGYLTDAVIVNRLFPAAASRRSIWSWSTPPSPRYPCCARPSTSRRWWAARCSTGSPRLCSATGIQRRSSMRGSPSSSRSTTRAPACASPFPSPVRGTSR
jgi:arsenite-transporting ATPase